MPPDSTDRMKIFLDRNQFTIINIVQLIAALIGIFVALYSFPQLAPFIIALLVIGLVAYPFWKRWRTRHILQKELPTEFFSEEVIQLATQYYIPPYCAESDPTQRDDHLTQDKLNSESQQKLFDTIDAFINETSREPFLWLLGDSGTGKSAFVLNYYARNRHRSWWKRYPLVVVPLGLPDIEKYITSVKKKSETVIFLDGFDEDTKAVENHEVRFNELLTLCRDFKRVLITCRTQFFPIDTAIPRRSSTPRLGPRRAGKAATYQFSLLYISPFTDDQVKAYLKKRYSVFHRKQRLAGFRLIKRLPTLVVRPMLLAYIPDLLQSGQTFEYTFQLYEEMVDAWLEREYPYVKDADKVTLRNFSERLSIDLYTNREMRGAERVKRDELTRLAREWHNFNLNEWQLSSRSLLNRDAAGYYKFAHRSIMEYLFVKRMLDDDYQLIQINRTDQMNAFLLEMFKDRTAGLIPYSGQGKNMVMASYPVKLRLQAGTNISDSDAEKMIRKWGFFDATKNKNGKGLFHIYQDNERNGAETIMDYATGLMWQRSGSAHSMLYADAEQYIGDLNNQKFAGYADWRLPTLEEAMSLMEPTKRNGDLYIDPVFDKTQRGVWTADKASAGVAWYVSFYDGNCHFYVFHFYYVRAVRSGQS